MSFTARALGFAAFLAVAAYTVGVGARRWPDLHRKLPRSRVFGECLGVVCLVWAAYHVCPMLEGGLEKYRALVKLLVPVVAVLSYFYLDFLFARALGGLLLLVVNSLLQGAFVARVPMRPLFSVLCYAIGFLGLLVIAAPWRLRDLLDRTGQSSLWRRSVCAGLLVSSGVYAVFSLAG